MIVDSSLGYSELVELYGEELGRSFLRRQAHKVAKVSRAAGRATVKAAGVVARNPATIATGGLTLLAPKSVQKKLNSGARIAATSGASLLFAKSDRNLVGKTARAAQTYVGRPAAHVVATVARNPVVQKSLMTAARGAAAAYTGGGSELALQASNLVSRARKFVPKEVQGVVRDTLRSLSPSGSSSSSAPADVADAAEKSKLPIVPIAIGGVGLLALALFMGKKKGKA